MSEDTDAALERIVACLEADGPTTIGDSLEYIGAGLGETDNDLYPLSRISTALDRIADVLEKFSKMKGI